MFKISMNDIDRLFKAISEADTLYLPIERGEQIEFTHMMKKQRYVWMHFIP